MNLTCLVQTFIVKPNVLKGLPLYDKANTNITDVFVSSGSRV